MGFWLYITGAGTASEPRGVGRYAQKSAAQSWLVLHHCPCGSQCYGISYRYVISFWDWNTHLRVNRPSCHFYFCLRNVIIYILLFHVTLPEVQEAEICLLGVINTTHDLKTRMALFLEQSSHAFLFPELHTFYGREVVNNYIIIWCGTIDRKPSQLVPIRSPDP